MSHHIVVALRILGCDCELSLRMGTSESSMRVSMMMIAVTEEENGW